MKDLYTIFEQTVQKVPPAGAGECALPKLLQYAYLHQLKPLAMAEFWWGDSPKNEIRHHGYYYPSCRGKCEPILQHMLQGLEVDENPLLNPVHEEEELEIVFEDEWLLVVNKPAGMLSVPGKAEDRDSVYHRLKKKYPEATGPMIVHRLDMATSGFPQEAIPTADRSFSISGGAREIDFLESGNTCSLPGAKWGYLGRNPLASLVSPGS